MEKIPKLIKPLRTAYEAKTKGINKNNKKEQANLPPSSMNDQVLALRSDLRNANSNVIVNPYRRGL